MEPWQMGEVVVLEMREAIGGDPLSEPFPRGSSMHGARRGERQRRWFTW